MNTQLLMTLLLIGVAVFYFLRRGLHQWRNMHNKQGNGCGGGCGCAPSSVPSEAPSQVFLPSEQLTLRQRTDRSN